MNRLPEPPAAPAAGQAHNPLTDSVINAAVEHAIEKAKLEGTSPDVVIGTTPPVPQPGRPPMSEKATDASVMMIAAGFLSICLGAAVSGVLYFSGNANETVVIAICTAPPVTFVALKSLVKSAKQAAPAETHNHYTGTVIQNQRETRTENKGVWVKTNNRSH
ncbi:hypothetical protein [Streptomyces europaeiscabiei]|uniref:hypothetical protein n=1 Tax=Streptomyces europaeiscabiei TaxID=146819 RepID=UPI0029BE2D31|nr:hypothetical protein [Streptomyces europaeiscabiei]MDX2528035.1 hypothetical protein [Streptomyces europaeiscabiei]MDX3713395.1 hypothetical protein [Streptomyces europaeiscabiei]